MLYIVIDYRKLDVGVKEILFCQVGNMLFVVTVVFMGTPFGPNRYPFWFESDRERAFSGLLPVYGAAFIHDLHDPPSPPLSFRSFFRFLSVREVLESPFYGYFFYPFWYGVEPRLHVCCLISSCECFTTSTSLALACGPIVFRVGGPC